MDDVILLDRKNEIRQSTIKSIKNCFVLLYTIYIILAVIIYIYFITISIKYNNYKYSTLKGLQHLMDTNFNHYSLQLNLYRFILESKYNFKVKNMYIVCLHPANKNNDYLIYTVYPMVQELQIILANIHEKK